MTIILTQQWTSFFFQRNVLMIADIIRIFLLFAIYKLPRSNIALYNIYRPPQSSATLTCLPFSPKDNFPIICSYLIFSYLCHLLLILTILLFWKLQFQVFPTGFLPIFSLIILPKLSYKNDQYYIMCPAKNLTGATCS